MAKTKFAVLLLVAGLVMTIGCSMSMSPISNTVDVGSVDLTQEMKRGKACEARILVFIPIGGRASVVDAAKAGNISKIKAVDYERNSYLLYAEDCVIVHGD